MYKNKKGFTMIELLITMTVFFILVMMSYVNYAYYQNISKVKIALKEITQSIHNGKNMAINGLNKNGKNQSIGVYFSKGSNEVVFYSYNFDSQNIVLDDSFIIEKRKLQNNVLLKDLSGFENVMIYFSAIKGENSMYVFSGRNILSTINSDQLSLIISYKDAQFYPLKREVKYFKDTNMIDY